MTQDELREAVFEALLDYESFKKTRRLKALKKALQGTMVATMISSTGLMAAGQGRSNQGRETSSFMASSSNAMSAMTKLPQDDYQLKVVSGAAYFGVSQHSLAQEDESLLMRLVGQIPKEAELTIVGCTDSLGGVQINKKLGMKRAQTVADFLERQGYKVKKVTNLISQSKRANSLARRVDIIVDSSMLPTEAHAQPLQTNQYIAPAQSQTRIDQHKLWHETDHPGTQSKVSKPIDKPVVMTNKQSIEALPKIDTLNNRARSDQQIDQRQLHLVLGVTHYALNSYVLASAHKERLMELIKQLPKDAELTVIGRADSKGIQAFNKNLGNLRAKSVANFLASQGVNVKAIGSKLSSSKYSDWMARRVDIVVDSAQMPLEIVLPPPVPQENSVRTVSPKPKYRPKSSVGAKKPVVIEQEKSIHTENPKPKSSIDDKRAVVIEKEKSLSTESPEPKSQIDGKKAEAIEKDVSRSINRARAVYNGNSDEQTFSDNPEWWDDAAKANKSCLESGDPESCLPVSNQ
jgi:outer membrane protein OmpA-like peptidoglycan-associated protein